MLKIILKRLKPQAEKIMAEEQAGFRAGRSTTELVFKLRILREKYLQHQQDLFHVFKTSRRPLTGFDMQLCGFIMKKYNINANLIRVIKNLCDKASSAVLFNNSTEDWFRTSVGV